MPTYNFWKEYCKAMEEAKKKQEPAKPTIEQCAALLKNLIGRNEEWHIAVYAEHDVRIYNNRNCMCSFISLEGLYQHLLERQRQKTITVEVLREDAETVAAMTSQDLLVRRFAEACKKGLQAS